MSNKLGENNSNDSNNLMVDIVTEMRALRVIKKLIPDTGGTLDQHALVFMITIARSMIFGLDL